MLEDKEKDEGIDEIEDEEIEFFDIRIRTNHKSLKRAWLAAKKLVNLGELSKAMAQFKTIGIAPMTTKIREEVNMKFPILPQDGPQMRKIENEEDQDGRGLKMKHLRT